MPSSHPTRQPRPAHVTLGVLGLLPFAALGQSTPPALPAELVPVAALVIPTVPRVAASPRIKVPAVEPDTAAVFVAGPSPFGGKLAPLATGQTLTAPVTINANTSTDALTATQTGTGRALNGVINNSASTLTALKGATNGKGAALGGLNSGTTGPAGQFQVTNVSNAQPSLVSTTAGTGSALQGVSTNTSGANTPAVLGQSTAASDSGVGVEGDGNYIGVRASTDSGYGVYATSTGGGFALYGSSGSGIAIYGTAGASAGVVGSSSSNAGIYGDSLTGNGVTGITSTASGNAAYGVYGQGDNTYGVVGISANGTGMSARSTKGYALTATSSNSIGVYAYTGSSASSASYAGYFIGQLRTTSTMTAQSYVTTSDRNEKQAFEAVDGATVLDKIAAIPIGAWTYKDKPGVRHIGPMAQDFRAAFGLGADDTHIDLVDSAGVSLAAIQALRLQVKERDARIEALEARAARAEASTATLDALAARLAAVELAQAATAASPVAAP